MAKSVEENIKEATTPTRTKTSLPTRTGIGQSGGESNNGAVKPTPTEGK